MAGGEGPGGAERGEIAEVGGGERPGLGGRRGGVAADEFFHLVDQRARLGGAAAVERDGGERGGGLGERAAGAGEGGPGDACVGREGRGGVETKLERAEIAAGGVFPPNDAVRAGERAAVARTTAMVVDDGMEKLGGNVGHDRPRR